jgi:hypothetical protein
MVIPYRSDPIEICGDILQWPTSACLPSIPQHLAQDREAFRMRRALKADARCTILVVLVMERTKDSPPGSRSCQRT